MRSVSIERSGSIFPDRPLRHWQTELAGEINTKFPVRGRPFFLSPRASRRRGREEREREKKMGGVLSCTSIPAAAAVGQWQDVRSGSGTLHPFFRGARSAALSVPLSSPSSSILSFIRNSLSLFLPPRSPGGEINAPSY